VALACYSAVFEGQTSRTKTDRNSVSCGLWLIPKICAIKQPSKKEVAYSIL